MGRKRHRNTNKNNKNKAQSGQGNTCPQDMTTVPKDDSGSSPTEGASSNPIRWSLENTGDGKNGTAGGANDTTKEVKDTNEVAENGNKQSGKLVIYPDDSDASAEPPVSPKQELTAKEAGDLKNTDQSTPDTDTPGELNEQPTATKEEDLEDLDEKAETPASPKQDEPHEIEYEDPKNTYSSTPDIDELDEVNDQPTKAEEENLEDSDTKAEPPAGHKQDEPPAIEVDDLKNTKPSTQDTDEHDGLKDQSTNAEEENPEVKRVSEEKNNDLQKVQMEAKENKTKLDELRAELEEIKRELESNMKTNADLRDKLCQREYENNELNRNNRCLTNQLETSKIQIEELKAKCFDLRQAKDELSGEYNELKLKLDSTEANNKRQKTKIQEQEQRIELLNGNLKEMDRQIKTFKEGNAKLHSQLNHFDDEVKKLSRNERYLTSQLVKSNSQVEQLKAECLDLRKVKDDLSDRLSEIMSARLRDGNPDIADLSDEYRPTKLAEMYSELYDNEWTNAYSAMEEINKPGRLIIMFLLDIFMDVYYFCCDEMDSMWISMERWFLYRNSPDYTKISKSLKDSRKIKAVQMIEEMQKKYVGRLQKLCNESFTLIIEDGEVMSYIEKSVELGLMMAANDPPVYVCLPGWIPVCERKVPNIILDEEEQKDETIDDENDMGNTNTIDASPNTDAAQNSETMTNQQESHSTTPKDNSSESCDVVNALKAANQDEPLNQEERAALQLQESTENQHPDDTTENSNTISLHASEPIQDDANNTSSMDTTAQTVPDSQSQTINEDDQKKIITPKQNLEIERVQTEQESYNQNSPATEADVLEPSIPINANANQDITYVTPEESALENTKYQVDVINTPTIPPVEEGTVWNDVNDIISDVQTQLTEDERDNEFERTANSNEQEDDENAENENNGAGNNKAISANDGDQNVPSIDNETPGDLLNVTMSDVPKQLTEEEKDNKVESTTASNEQEYFEKVDNENNGAENTEAISSNNGDQTEPPIDNKTPGELQTMSNEPIEETEQTLSNGENDTPKAELHDALNKPGEEGTMHEKDSSEATGKSMDQNPANEQKEVTTEEPTQQVNEPFDKNVYKEYTCRGRYLDYVVWPMLRLHKDGGVLSKGVAQGTKNSVKSEETYCWWKDFA